MSWLRSSIGKKIVMSVSGILLIGFIVSHLVGNLLIFLGPEAINTYAKKLLDLGPGLWVMRIGLIAVVIVHIVTSIQISADNRRARPVRYAQVHHQESTLSGRTMMLSGLMLLAFIVYHLLHFTFQIVHPEVAHLVDAAGRHDVYTMVVESFRQPLITGVYVIAMVLLGMHLSHGIGSAFQTLGINTDGKDSKYIFVGRIVGLALALGYIAIPVSIFFGIIG